MRINTNISAMNTYSRLTAANNSKSGSLAKLSSGLRINKAGDDAAGLAISEKMRGQIGGLKQATRNAQDAISLIQTAEGGLNETHSILNRMRDLAVQSANDTNTVTDRKEIQKEMDELSAEVSRISKDTQFNTQNLLGGGFKAKFHIGANEGQNLELNIADMSSDTLKVGTKVETDRVGVKAEAAVASTGTVNTDVTVKAADGKEYTIKVVQGEAATNATKTDQDIAINGTEITVTLGTSWDGSASQNLDMDNDKLVNLINGLAGGNFSATVAADKGVETVAVATAIDIKDGTEATEEVIAKKAGEYDGINVSSQEAADTAITTINNAIETVSAERSKLGATQNRLDHTINNLTATAENLSEAESRIRDVDMAEEMMEFTKSNILSQAATSMLAQANQMPQGVLQLLQ